MTQSQFGGDKKTGKWAFANLERRMVTWMVPKVPSWLETYHLTMLTLVWSIGIVVASLLARESLHWLWLVSGFIVLQYLSDVLDGAVGRHRDTGLFKWGFYMDHFLDFLFLASIIVGYSLALPHIAGYWFFALLVVGGAVDGQLVPVLCRHQRISDSNAGHRPHGNPVVLRRECCDGALRHRLAALRVTRDPGHSHHYFGVVGLAVPSPHLGNRHGEQAQPVRRLTPAPPFITGLPSQ